MSPVVIREAVRADAEALAALIVPLGYEIFPHAVAGRLAAMARVGNRTFVAEKDRRVIGCITTSAMQVIHRPAPVGRISMMVVEEEQRGRGIGRSLVAAAEDHLRDTGCHIVEVTSRFDLTEAHLFYEKLGFEKTSVRLARNLQD